MNGEQKLCRVILHILFHSSCTLVLSNLVDVPENSLLSEHGSLDAINMACKSDNQTRLKWKVLMNNGLGIEEFYNGYYLREDAKFYCTVITDEPRKCYLRLSNVPQVAKTYICVEPGSLREASADLIWIKSLPVCNSSSTEDRVNLTCSIEFRGNWAPTMEWKEQRSHEEKVISVGVNLTTVPNERVTSTLVMDVPKGKSNFICTTKFDISAKPRSTTATNVPEYNRVWAFPFVPKIEDGMFEEATQNEMEDETVNRSPHNEMKDTRYSLAPICGAIGSVLIVITLSVTLVLIHDRKTGLQKIRITLTGCFDGIGEQWKNQGHQEKINNNGDLKDAPFEMDKINEDENGMLNSSTLLCPNPREW